MRWKMIITFTTILCSFLCLANTVRLQLGSQLIDFVSGRSANDRTCACVSPNCISVIITEIANCIHTYYVISQLMYMLLSFLYIYNNPYFHSFESLKLNI